MGQPLVIWGATGQAKVLAEFLPDIGFDVVAVFDNNPTVVPPLSGIPLFIGHEGFNEWRHSHNDPAHFLIAIGGDKGADRQNLHTWLGSHGLIPAHAIHPSSYVARNAILGAGCQILARATVGAQAVLESECIVNTAASVDHDCALKAGVHVAPGAILAGGVSVGRCAMIGAGAVVLPGIQIGDGSVVGAGAVVTHDVPAGITVTGVPARAHFRTDGNSRKLARRDLEGIASTPML